jgi:hypothetical protein
MEPSATKEKLLKLFRRREPRFTGKEIDDPLYPGQECFWMDMGVLNELEAVDQLGAKTAHEVPEGMTCWIQKKGPTDQ